MPCGQTATKMKRMMKMTKGEQAHIDIAYVNVKSAMDELAQVLHKDKYLMLVQNKLYALEDTLYQYISNPKRRRAQ